MFSQCINLGFICCHYHETLRVPKTETWGKSVDPFRKSLNMWGFFHGGKENNSNNKCVWNSSMVVYIPLCVYVCVCVIFSFIFPSLLPTFLSTFLLHWVTFEELRHVIFNLCFFISKVFTFGIFQEFLCLVPFSLNRSCLSITFLDLSCFLAVLSICTI